MEKRRVASPETGGKERDGQDGLERQEEHQGMGEASILAMAFPEMLETRSSAGCLGGTGLCSGHREVRGRMAAQQGSWAALASIRSTLSPAKT